MSIKRGGKRYEFIEGAHIDAELIHAAKAEIYRVAALNAAGLGVLSPSQRLAAMLLAPQFRKDQEVVEVAELDHVPDAAAS